MKRVYLSAILALFSYSSWAQLFQTKETIDINNIKALHLVHGDMWWDPTFGEAKCEYPKGSGKNVGFASSLWIGGFDPQSQLHVSAQTYRQNGTDYWPGPLDNGGNTDIATITGWAKIWKVTRFDVELFQSFSTHTAVNTPTSILTWPAKGNPYAKGYNNATLQVTTDMAPFIDVNSDGTYNPLMGDYPKMKGDQMLWWVINDNGPSHSESNLPSLKVEIQNSAYAYKLPGVLNTVVYYEYLIHNKSGMQYDSLILGLSADMDLGYGFDDYIGYDSSHRMGIIYNASSMDGTGQANSYGATIPMAGVSLVELPGDNPGVVVPTGNFMYFSNDGTAHGNPSGGAQFYGYMTGSYRDNSPLVNDWDGVPGHVSKGYGVGPSVKYVYPGDPADNTQWSECNSNNPNGDRRFVISTNPFSLVPNATKKVCMALIVQPNAGGCPTTGFTTIKNMADSTWWYYSHPPALPTSVQALAISRKDLKLYPNPAQNILFIERPAGNSSDEKLVVYDALGRRMATNSSSKGNAISIDLSLFTPGVYHVVYTTALTQHTGIFVKE